LLNFGDITFGKVWGWERANLFDKGAGGLGEAALSAKHALGETCLLAILAKPDRRNLLFYETVLRLI
jgi:hypothetical protein